MELNTQEMEKLVNTTERLSLRSLKEIKKCGEDYLAADVIIAITLYNQSRALIKALDSALNQTMVVNKLARIVILDDQSDDDWLYYNDKVVKHDAITVLSARCGTPARARNQLLDYAKTTSVKWVARLDSDDYLDNKWSVEALYKEGEKKSSTFVLGSNRLNKNDVQLERTNVIQPELFKSKKLLLEFIDDFCSLKSEQELPSCNLLLRADSGFKYPDVRSAEDHWLVAKLLMLYNEKGAFVSSPFYSVYSLGGNDTKQNQKSSTWHEQRKRLNMAASIWFETLSSNKYLLGVGMEGVVFKEDNTVIKHFYPWSISDEAVSYLKALLPKYCKNLPKVQWSFDNGGWSYNTPYLHTRPMGQKETKKAVVSFLSNMYSKGICCLNIKRENILVLPDGDLLYIDIGKDIKAFMASYFLDMSARLYSIAIMGNDDDELVRRKECGNQSSVLTELAGFHNFYIELTNLLQPTTIASSSINNNELMCF